MVDDGGTVLIEYKKYPQSQIYETDNKYPASDNFIYEAHQIYRKNASKNLDNILANLGFSASYNDAQLNKLSAINHHVQSKPSEVFILYEFENADYNMLPH